jgi:hypothetical protein
MLSNFKMQLAYGLQDPHFRRQLVGLPGLQGNPMLVIDE